MRKKQKSNADRLLSSYAMWGMLSITVFIVFIALLVFTVFFEKSNMLINFIMLLTGFLWIGITSVSRHIFVLLKRYIGKDISILEFLATQFIVLLFPLFYIKLRKEVRIYREKEMKADTAEVAE
jgi:hypothetical protein